MREKLASLKESLLFFFYPPQCAVCGATGYQNLCPRCQEKLDEAFDPKKFIANGGNGYADAMFCLFPYDSFYVQKLLFDWKQVDYKDFPPIFIPYLERFFRKKLLPKQIHYVAYLPRRRAARRKIGFDQAERIGELATAFVEMPLTDLLSRQGHAKTQHKSKYKHREKNIRGAFRAVRSFEGESVLLIDDIVTTGATAREGARILKQAGAMKVYILSIAH